jgi:hypothetical protein
MIELLIPIFIGLVLIWLSIKIRAKYKQLLNSGERSEGIVFDLEKSKNSDSNAQYPIIRFLTKKEVWITKRVDLGISFSTYEQGDKVSVIYNPKKPEEFMLESKWQMIASQVLLALGIISLVIGIILFVRNYYIN